MSVFLVQHECFSPVFLTFKITKSGSSFMRYKDV